MIYDKPIEGKYVILKSATEEDAEFTRNIRRDPQFKDCFPPLDNTIEQQKQWLKFQREKKDDYFFVVWDKNENRIGTISVYDITESSCESGRIAIKGNAFQSIEAQLLLFYFAFDYLKKETVVGYVISENDRALRFNKMFGCIFEEPMMHNNQKMIKAIHKKAYIENAMAQINKIMYR